MLVLRSCRGSQSPRRAGSPAPQWDALSPERTSESFGMVCARDVLKTLAAAGCWAASGRFNLVERGCENALTIRGCQAQNHKILRLGERNMYLIVAVAPTRRRREELEAHDFQPLRSMLTVRVHRPRHVVVEGAHELHRVGMGSPHGKQPARRRYGAAVVRLGRRARVVWRCGIWSPRKRRVGAALATGLLGRRSSPASRCE